MAAQSRTDQITDPPQLLTKLPSLHFTVNLDTNNVLEDDISSLEVYELDSTTGDSQPEKQSFLFSKQHTRQ